MSVIPHYTPASVLKEAQEVSDRGGSRHMDWGGMQLSMPKSHRAYWGGRYPDLNSKDGDIKLKAWERFLKSDESKPYRVSRPKYFAGNDIGQAKTS